MRPLSRKLAIPGFFGAGCLFVIGFGATIFAGRTMDLSGGMFCFCLFCLLPGALVAKCESSFRDEDQVQVTRLPFLIFSLSGLFFYFLGAVNNLFSSNALGTYCFSLLSSSVVIILGAIFILRSIRAKWNYWSNVLAFLGLTFSLFIFSTTILLGMTYVGD